MVVAGVVAIVAVVLVAGASGQLAWVGLGLLLTVAAAASVAVAVAVRRWGHALVRELQHGYTTHAFTMGRFWFASSPDAPITHGWVQWRWDATWVLAGNGGVVDTIRRRRSAGLLSLA